MRGMTRAGPHGIESLLERRARVPHRYAMSARRERANQIESAFDLRSDRDDADVGRRALDFRKDVRARERAVVAKVFGGPAQARLRLRAGEFRVDEIAFEMRGQHAR